MLFDKTQKLRTEYAYNPKVGLLLSRTFNNITIALNDTR